MSVQILSGPVISPTSKERILGLIASAEQEGGKIHLDGRGIQVEGYEHGNFIGPTVIEANTSMKCYKFVHTSLHLLNFNMLILPFFPTSGRRSLVLFSWC